MILLDTHAWVWHLADPDRLSVAARRRIEEEVRASCARVSSISVWEVAMLGAKGRLEFTVPVDDWLARAQAAPGITFEPADNAVALRSTGLPEDYPSDPADRMIAATALLLGAELVTKDRHLRRVEGLPTVW